MERKRKDINYLGICISEDHKGLIENNLLSIINIV